MASRVVLVLGLIAGMATLIHAEHTKPVFVPARLHQMMHSTQPMLRSAKQHPSLRTAAHIQGHAFGVSVTNSTNGEVNKCQNIVSTLTNSSQCRQILDLVSLDNHFGSVEMKSLCQNACLDKFMTVMDKAVSEGCMDDFSASELTLMCSFADVDCTIPAATRCVDDFIAAGCEVDYNPGDECLQYGICAMEREDECHALFRESFDEIIFTVSFPVSMDPNDFREKFLSQFIATTARMARCNITQVSVQSVVAGSIVVTAAIRVPTSASMSTLVSLQNSFVGHEFKNEFNRALNGELVVMGALLISISSTGPNPTPIQTPHLTPAPHPSGNVNRTRNNTLPGVPTPVQPPVGHCANNCSHHGKCVGHSCVCAKGYGKLDRSAPNDCADYTLDQCPSKCSGHGHCIYNPVGLDFVCSCLDGFTGDTCNIWDNCKSKHFCSSHGTCSRPYGAHAASARCECDPGYAGESCTEIDGGCPHSCSGRGICTPALNGLRQCTCDPGFGAPGCGTVRGDYCPDNCSGLGVCNPSTLECKCDPTAFGNSCSEISNVCGGCRHGFCYRGVCECLPGFSGPHCTIFNATEDTNCRALDFCSAKGVCHLSNSSTANDYVCTCFEGFSGAKCTKVDVNFADQCPNHCSGHGTCTLVSAPHCNCNTGFTGSDCSQSACPAVSGRVCSNHGICEKAGNTTAFACTCDEGYSSDSLKACETSLCPNDCNGNGQCKADGSCVCRDGFSGLDCSRTTSAKGRQMLAEVTPKAKAPAVAREDEETGDTLDLSSCLNSCHKRGECVMGKCSCHTGYTGDDCSRETPSLYEAADDLDNLDLLEIGTLDASKESMARLWN